MALASDHIGNGTWGAGGLGTLACLRIIPSSVACALGVVAFVAARADPLPSMALPTTPPAPVQGSAPAYPVDPTVDFPADIEARRRHRLVLALQQDSAPPALSAAGSTSSAAAIEARKSYWIPAADILGFDLLLNAFNRSVIGDEYKSTAASIRRNLQSSWRVDNDPFVTNQLGHPYQGSMYHGFARSAGLNYWESLGYTFAGSAFWEIAGETTPPSLNDQITTSFGGSFLGESLFRMSNLVLQQSTMKPLWRELAAAAISPATGFNRLAYGDRFDAPYPSNDAPYYGRLSVGVSTLTNDDELGSAIDSIKRTEALADFSLDYGLPGDPDYRYRRPFDHFVFKATVSSANGFENLMTRGLLVGTDYDVGKNYRGVWGLYGSYDYIEPQTFRISSTALSLGTTAQWWLSQGIALQGSALAGAGYAAVGSINGTADNDHHYGVAPQALVALRLILGDRVSIDTTTRAYFVSDVGGVNQSASGKDNIYRTDAAVTYRIHTRHAVSLRYLYSRRDSSSAAFGDKTQSSGTLGIFYTYLGGSDFGAVDWRE
ncbi:MAG: DUF3943 domain-containing protein [Betaproteobacteria bacterium]